MILVRFKIDNKESAQLLSDAISEVNVCPVTGSPILPTSYPLDDDEYINNKVQFTHFNGNNVPQNLIDVANSIEGVTVIKSDDLPYDEAINQLA